MIKTQQKIDINSLEAGKELDALVAEKVMGFKVKWEKPHGLIQDRKSPYIYFYFKNGVGPPENMKGWNWIECPNYSTSISAAWEVVEKMLERNLSPVIWFGFQGECFARIDPRRPTVSFGPDSSAKTAPEAICKAALKAIMKE